MARTLVCFIIVFLLFVVVGVEAFREVFQVTNSGTTAFSINGNLNPEIYLERGQQYAFELNNPAHPFYIRTLPDTSTGHQYTSGVAGNGLGTGMLNFTVPYDAPSVLYYSCFYHAVMKGTIHISDKVYDVSFSGGNYVFDGGLGAAPALQLNRGSMYVFNVNASGQPLWIKSTNTIGTSDSYDTYVSNNGLDVGYVRFFVGVDSPATLYYTSENSAAAGNSISISNKVFQVRGNNTNSFVLDAMFDPTLVLYRGFTYTFDVQLTGHLFFLKTQHVVGTGSLYEEGVCANGQTIGELVFTVPLGAPAMLYYQCAFHAPMWGTIYILNPPVTYTVTALSTTDFTINGRSDPTLALAFEGVYYFSIRAPLHKFYIKTAHTLSPSDNYDTGVTNNGASYGADIVTLTFVVDSSAPVTLYYQCELHPTMWGTLNIVDQVFPVTTKSSCVYVVGGLTNPSLSLTNGQTYAFDVSVSSFDFYLKTTNSLGTSDQYSTGVINNGAALGVVLLSLNDNITTLYYQSSSVLSMGASMTVSGGVVATTTTTTTTTLSTSASPSAITKTVNWCLSGCNKQVIKINVGDTIKWVNTDGNSHTVTDMSCNGSSLVFDKGCSPKLFNFGLTVSGEEASYRFTEPGTYGFYCTVHSGVMEGQVLVSTNRTGSFGENIRPYIEAHGAMMFLAFGFLLPLGGFMAVSGRVNAHKVVQCVGLVFAIVGYSLAFTYSEKNGRHFNQIHSYCGFVLLILAVLFQPIFVTWSTLKNNSESVLALHRRNGQLLVFFGIANIFLGLVAIVASPLVRTLYGIYVGLMIIAYILYQPSKTKFVRGVSARTRVNPDDSLRSIKNESEVDEYPGFEKGDLEMSSSSGEPLTDEDMELRAILEGSSDAILGADDRGLITSWNKAASDMFGYSEAEIKGQSLQVLMPDAYKRRHQNALDREAQCPAKSRRLKSYSNIYEVRGVSKSGLEFPVQISVSSFSLKGKIHFTGIIRDLSGGTALPSDVGPSADAATRDQVALARLAVQAKSLGAAMQVAHNLKSSTEISRSELQTILMQSMKDNRIAENDTERAKKAAIVVSSLLNEGARGGNSLHFVDLIRLLAKHGLTVSSTGTLSFSKEKSAQEELTRSQRAQAWLQSEWQKIFWLTLYFSVNIVVFFVTYFHWRKRAENEGLTEWVPVARGGGMCLNLNCALIVLPMCRILLSYLRATWVVHFTPFDSSIEFHKLIAWMILFWSVVHTVGHFGNYNTLPQKFSYYLFETNGGLTGFIIWVAMVPIYLGAMETIRRGTAESRGKSALTRRLYSHAVFFGTHHFFVVFFVVLIIHGIHFLNPHFWMFFVGPGTVYCLERAYREFWSKRDYLQIVRGVTLSGGVVAVSIAKPGRGFNYKSGQYLFLQVPAISRFEWHPFTISSAPEDEHVTLFIRNAGDWTGDLHKMFKENPVSSSSSELPICRIDGPYGTASEEVFGYETAVLVGAGIGSTPAASILKHIQYRMKEQAGCRNPACGCKCTCCYFKLKKLYFIWTNRDAAAFQWFADYLGELQREEARREEEAAAQGQAYEKLIDIRVYLTGIKHSKDDLSTLLFHVGVESVHDTHQQDVITSLRSVTEFARPDFDKFFSEITNQHLGQDVGVFFCGPAPLGKSLRDACLRHTAFDKARFIFNQEIF